MINKIAIIGSGVMGSGIAQSFAVSGYSVTINDIQGEFLAHAKNRISENLSLLIAEGVLTDQEKQDALANITYSIDLGAALREADFIIEAIPEVIELKLSLYQQMENIIKPDAIVASNTSTFPISQLMEKASFANRMVITHFFNPGHLVPLVEIVQHDETKPDIVETTLALMRKIGKSPILLKKKYRASLPIASRLP